MLKYFLAALLLVTHSASADVRLPKVIGSHMVLQQKSNVNIWGWADPEETVKIEADWLKEPVSCQADEKGNWHATLKTEGPGKSHSLTITGKNQIQLKDILFGEVWIASGQSNMEMPLMKVSGAYTGIKDSEEEIANANHPEIRLFQAGNFSSREPLEDVETGIEMYGVPIPDCQWHPCQPGTISTFSSTAYFFARELQSQLKVPIGIIDASWGGTPAEAWTPKSGLEKLGYDELVKQAVDLPQNPNQKIPTRLYNGMIHPLRHMKIKGAIWYQGEGNATRAEKYHELFSMMITEWRSAFGQEFPFYFVQLAPFNYPNVNSAYLRESQMETMSLPGTGMAVTMDIGNLTDIHPKNKQEVGRRLALWALAKDYGKNLVFSGPVYKESRFENGNAILQFDYVGSGLTTNDGESPNHFTIAGEDKVFHPATVEIVNDQLKVSSEKVPEPKAVRYSFDNDSMPNLVNKEGLPASSFRTDKW